MLNEARRGSVGGPPANPTGFLLSAVAAGKPGTDDCASRLKVGPGWLPTFLYGPYHVARVAPDYTWAVVSGGPPTVRAPDGSGCSVGGNGLWLFSRAAGGDKAAAALKAARAAAADAGYSLSGLIDVPQEGCAAAPGGGAPPPAGEM